MYEWYVIERLGGRVVAGDYTHSLLEAIDAGHTARRNLWLEKRGVGWKR